MSNQTEKQSAQTPQLRIGPGGRRGPGGPLGMQQVEKAKDGKKTLRRLFRYFGAERIMVVVLLLAVVVMVIGSVYAPKLQSDAIDLITNGQFGRVGKVLCIMLVVYGIFSICNLIQSLVSAHLSQRIVKRMREDLFERIVHLPVKYLDTHPHGDVMSRMTNDVENISNTVSQSLSSLVSGALTIVGTVAMMIYLCWQLALLSCVTVILTIVVTKFLSTNMKRFFVKRQELLGKLNSTTEENITGYKTVVAYNRQKKVMDEFENISDELTKTGIIAEILGGSMGPVMNVINNIGFVIIAAFGGYFAIKNIVSVGMISAFIVYAKQFGRPINEIAQLYGQIQTAIAGAERVFDIMDEEPERKEGNAIMPEGKGMVSFQNVNFSYVPEKQVLYDFSLDVRAGHKVALVGATGSGKTTVVNLLMRFYEINSGDIFIDGVNIRDISLEELRKNIAIVLQDTVLFSDTIANNLKYADPMASDEDMIRAANIGNCHRMIQRMGQGYETMLTESGQNLSQGQRQLLSIARAVLADPKILILDEATSSVDTRTEKKIQDAMINLMKDRTSLIIAHRLSTIRDADFIVVLDKGRIVESGNHEELIAQKGRYYDLYMTQFSGKEI
ncbi:MAG: ABC transporter ATP-binding protein [Lachnospiraceae bacterium]|nr:ABC transporter ATP-binding protein [Lachnospiraceae bacterium]